MLLFLLFTTVFSTVFANWVQLNENSGPVYNTEENALLSGRRNAATWSIGSDVYILGGKADDSRTNDFWKYEIKAKRWFWQPNPPTELIIRSGSSQWSLDGLLWLYGGRNDSSTQHALDDLWSYNPATREWKQYFTNINPGPRYGCSFWKDESNNYMYLFGGKSNSVDILDDIWRFDFKSSSWSSVPPPENMGSFDDSVTTSIDNNVYFFGKKFFRLNTKTMTLTDLECESICPDKRDDSVMWSGGDNIYLFGGRINNKIYGDFWVYHTQENHWQELTGTNPFPRWGSNFAQTRSGNLYMLGGQEQDSSLLSNDFWSYTWDDVETNTTVSPTLNNNYTAILNIIYGISITILVLSLFSCTLLTASFYIYKNRQREVIKIGEDRAPNEIALNVTL